ncbi:MAG: hypothetical protein AAF270_14785, partial [Pseudomonadota bacterium]
ELVGRLQDGSTRALIDNALRGTGISADTVVNRIETGAPNAALERQWVADDLAKVAEAMGLNLERKDDLEVARERLNEVHVELGTALERAEVLRDDGVIEEAREIRFHFDQERLDDTMRAVRQELRGQGVNEAQLEARAVEIESRAFDRVEAEQREYLATRPEILSDPGAVYRTDEEGRGRITDQELADRLDREIEVILDRAPANQSISEAVASDFKERYPDMPDHVVRGLGDTYETSFRLNNEQELREAELEAAENATARDAALEANRLVNGIRQSEADGISAAERRELVTVIETNVREGANDDDRAYTDDRFEQLVRERDLLEANGASTQQRVALATEFTQLSLARQNDELSPEEARRADAILRDTADKYGSQMRDGLQRDDTREFMSIHDDGYFSRDERADEFEIERRREFRFAMQPYQVQQIDNPEIRRVVEHERSGDVSPSLATDEERLSYREQIEKELDDEQIERLREGDSDALENVSDDRLERLYAAKAYLQSDAATANSEAYREVVQEIAEEQYELQKDRLVDSEREGGPVHG